MIAARVIRIILRHDNKRQRQRGQGAFIDPFPEGRVLCDVRK